MYTEQKYNDSLYHHGIKGQRWGVRRYQNADGSLTPSGRKRYGVTDKKNVKGSDVSDSVKRMRKKGLSSKNPYYYEEAYKEAGISNKEIKRSIKELQDISNAEYNDRDAREFRGYFEKEYGFDKNKYLDNALAYKKRYYDEEIARTQKAIKEHRNSEYVSNWKRYLKEYKKNRKALDTKKGISDFNKKESETYDYMKSEYDKKQVSNFSNRDNVLQKARKETKSLLDQLKKVEYGSDKWFDIREQYYTKSESYNKEYANAMLKDLGKDKVSDITKEYITHSKAWAAPLLGNNSYVYSDYKNIADPISNSRDYDLEDKYNKWIAKKKG